MSMMATFLSAIAFLGIPAEVFVFGFQYILVAIGAAVGVLIAAEFFMPIFYEMDSVSINAVSASPAPTMTIRVSDVSLYLKGANQQNEAKSYMYRTRCIKVNVERTRDPETLWLVKTWKSLEVCSPTKISSGPQPGLSDFRSDSQEREIAI